MKTKLNKTLRLKALLESGYFPEELPPPFSTRDIATYRKSIGAAWSNLNGEYPKTMHEIYSIPRIKKVRRNLCLVNPISQLYLAKLIADNWIEIRNYLNESKYAIETPSIEHEDSRAVPPPDFALLALRRAEISAAYDHALVSDISRFYGTLYTHAIPWALHSKDWCKKNLNNKRVYECKLGAHLDKAVRKGQDNKTIGIPVGPDTSRIISEIIGVAIDRSLQEKIKLDSHRAFRHVDDWYIGFDGAGEAEDAIATLATACRDYELELNADKTRTLQSASSVDRIWPTELREYRFRNSARDQSKSMEHYFTEAFQFSIENPDQNVLNYAIKRTKGILVKPENWHGYETSLLKAARSNATVIPVVVQILVSYNHNGYELGKVRIAKFVEDIIKKNAALSHHAEVSWSLFLAKALRIRLSRSAAESVSVLESSVCALRCRHGRATDFSESGQDDEATRWGLRRK